jgi:hypothetical protein
MNKTNPNCTNGLLEGLEGSCLQFHSVLIPLLTQLPFSVLISTFTFLDALGSCTNFSNLTFLEAFLWVLAVSGLEVQEITPGLSVMAITPGICFKRFDGVCGANSCFSLLQRIFVAASAASCTLLEGCPASSAAAKKYHQTTTHWPNKWIYQSNSKHYKIWL